MLDEFSWGRQDATDASECGSLVIPTGNEYVSNLRANGLSDQEIVALASVEAFGVVRDPEYAEKSIYSKFDTYYFKELLSQSSSQELPHREALVNTDLREHVEFFAENKIEYH
jgi:hypothetical protein